MKIKIGDKIYDAETEPIMIIFNTDAERKQVASDISLMEDHGGVRKYIAYPKGYSPEEIRTFMRIQELIV